MLHKVRHGVVQDRSTYRNLPYGVASAAKALALGKSKPRTIEATSYANLGFPMNQRTLGADLDEHLKMKQFNVPRPTF